eukprot:TRINITY_DN18037_c0_g1_i1.p2 TRINITY_DN18037_c0_g1~~TRINITY_DN18037_c0_g1_i1.p2  ORF type:complete len:150 (-),score=33.33 TRINITY_DN18037_c0_g1_i1:645-1043(-)
MYQCRAVNAAVDGSDDVATTRRVGAWSRTSSRHFWRSRWSERCGAQPAAIKDLAQQLILSSSTSEWLSAAGAVESIAIVWPFLRLVGKVDDADPLLLRAIDEQLLFTDGVDTLWETKWRSLASPATLAFEAN